MNTLPVEAITVNDGKPTTNSRIVAEIFGKEHKHVLRDIKALDIPEDFAASNFALGSYRDANNQERPMYDMTKDGFTFLVMGYNGAKAAGFKIAYINRFNEMEASLRVPALPITPEEKAIRALKVHLEVAALFECPKHLGQIESVKQVKQDYGFDFSTHLLTSPTQNNVADTEVMLEPTELGKHYGLSAVKMNQRLASQGLQSRVSGAWVPTPKAKGLCVKHSWARGNKSGYNLKWNLAKVQALLN